MSWSAEIADAIIAADAALDQLERDVENHVNPDVSGLREAVETLMSVAIGDEGQHFDSLEEARRFRAPRCWGTTSTFRNYATGQDEFHEPTCGSTEPHGPHII